MKYILDFIPYQEDNMDIEYYAEIENKIANNQSITENDAENFLRTINYIIRKNDLTLKYNYFKKIKENKDKKI